MTPQMARRLFRLYRLSRTLKQVNRATAAASGLSFGATLISNRDRQKPAAAEMPGMGNTEMSPRTRRLLGATAVTGLASLAGRGANRGLTRYIARVLRQHHTGGL